MMHLPILPILLPLVTGIALIFIHDAHIGVKRGVSLVSMAGLVAMSAYCLMVADDGAIRVYHVGNWVAPYGISLVLDRLAALMVTLASVVGFAVGLAARSGVDAQGRHFHVLLQFELAGLNGAFLTGDLFNLFVFFEVLLISSYALMLHGGGAKRVRTGLTYVILNLAGSSLFLIALGLIYGTLGTLNIADISLVLPLVAPEDQGLVRTAAMLLVTVFLLKAAILPLGFWLPHAYTAASVPVAALFAILTKVGIYALLRTQAVDLSSAPVTADLLQPWLAWLSVLTIAMGTIGALASKRLSFVVANLVVTSSGTLMAAIATGDPAAFAAALYYLPHTTLVTGALFLLAGRIASERGALADGIEKGPRLQSIVLLGGAYLILAVAASGTPPLSGFIGKIMLMQAFEDAQTGPGRVMWAALLISGFAAALVLARAASAFFWEPGRAVPAVAAEAGGKESERPLAVPAAPSRAARVAAVRHRLAPGLVFLLLCVLGLTVFARPLTLYASATAAQLADRSGYVTAVLGPDPKIERERRP